MTEVEGHEAIAAAKANIGNVPLLLDEAARIGKRGCPSKPFHLRLAPGQIGFPRGTG